MQNLKAAEPGQWAQMRTAQMFSMEKEHGPVGRQPGLTGLDALRVLGYWWRSRGRFWTGWHRAIDKLGSLGIKPNAAALTQKLTEEQADVVWTAQLEASQDLQRLAPSAVPPPFFQAQADADAREMMTRYLRRDLRSPIPKALPLPPVPKIPDPDDIPVKVPKPKIPSLPSLPSGKTLLLLFLAYLAIKDN